MNESDQNRQEEMPNDTGETPDPGSGDEILPDPADRKIRAFTLKALFFGLLGVIIISAFASLNDTRLQQTLMIGSHFPVAGLFFFFCVTLFWNLFWGLTPKRTWVGQLLPALFFLLFVIIAVVKAVKAPEGTAGWYSSLRVWSAAVLLTGFLSLMFSPLIYGRGWITALIGFIPAFAVSGSISALFHWNGFTLGFTVFSILLSCLYVFACLGGGSVLSKKELAVSLSMTFAACWVPTSGLYRYFHRMLILPWHYLPNMPEWKDMHVLEYLPKKLFPLAANPDNEMYNKVYSGFVRGMAEGTKTLGLGDLPLDAWAGPVLKWWAPMLILFAVCVTALALLVHRQWAHYEQLRYPLAQAASALFKKTGEKQKVADIFSRKLFWWGFTPVLGLYMIHYMAQWFPEYFPSIDMSWNMRGLYTVFPILSHIGWFYIPGGKFFFSIFAITYFISSEIGLTMGLSQFLIAFAAAQYYMATGQPVGGQNIEIFRGGAYFGYALILLYTGRTYFWAILKKSFGFGKTLEFEKESVFAARLFIAAFFAFNLILVMCGLDWLISFVFTLLLMLLMLVFTRIICETGIPFMQSFWFPTLIQQSLGTAFLGGGPMVIIFYLGAVLQQDIRECLMPYVSTSLKVADDVEVKRKPVALIIIGAVIVALVIGFLVTFWTFYNFGGMGSDGYANKSVPQTTFGRTIKPFTDLAETGQLEDANAASGLGKLRFLSFDGKVWSFIMAGAGAVILFSLIRFRTTKWPLHPVLFLVWGTYPMGQMYYSFLIGWAVKELIVKFGGGEVYEKLKPLFIGIIMGEVIASGISIINAFLYYFVFTDGLLPKALKILPT